MLPVIPLFDRYYRLSIDLIIDIASNYKKHHRMTELTDVFFYYCPMNETDRNYPLFSLILSSFHYFAITSLFCRRLLSADMCHFLLISINSSADDRALFYDDYQLFCRQILQPGALLSFGPAVVLFITIDCDYLLSLFPAKSAVVGCARTRSGHGKFQKNEEVTLLASFDDVIAESARGEPMGGAPKQVDQSATGKN